jgi:sucrose-6-phosphate hydrolase SacC (GH32 family)
MKNSLIKLLIITAIILQVSLIDKIAYSQAYCINEKGTNLYELENKALPGFILGCAGDSLKFLKKRESMMSWRKTNLQDGYFFLDVEFSAKKSGRLLATSYLGARLTKTGIEGKNNDVKWRLVTTDENDWYFLEHNTSGRYLSRQDNKLVLVEKKELSDNEMWKLSLKRIDLDAIESPILMMGNDKTGFRDPAVIYNEGVFYMYYSLVLSEENEKIYWYVAYSKSDDLISWTDPVIITPKDQNKNFASPGNVIRFNDEWILCMQTYPMPGYSRKDKLRFGNEDCRIWITRSKDLENWSEPEMLWVMGSGIDPGQMIDPFLIEDKNEKGKWWCFYKKDGASYSYSYDLKNWTYQGKISAGENVCVWIKNDEYYMMHSPEKGMGIIKTMDFNKWFLVDKENILGQEDWCNWAGQRVTAGFVLDMHDDPKVGKYLLFYHGQGPDPKTTEIINSGTDIGIAWSDDFVNWEWPGKEKKE